MKRPSSKIHWHAMAVVHVYQVCVHVMSSTGVGTKSIIIVDLRVLMLESAVFLFLFFSKSHL